MMNFPLFSTLLMLTCTVSTLAKGPAVPISTVSTTTEYDSLFGIHTQQRRIVPCASSLSILRGGAEDGEDAVKTVHTPASVEELDALLLKAGSEQQLVVIDFTAAWCGPCQTIAPIFQQLSETLTNVIFVKIDVDETPDVAAKYNVSAMPTFVFIKGGEIIDRLMGANVERLQEMIEENK